MTFSSSQTLPGQRQLPHLVEEEGAAVGLLESSAPQPGRAGERPLLVAEELAFENALGQGGAVELDHGTVGVWAAGVDGVGQKLLAHPRFAKEEHRGPRGRDLSQGGEDLRHGLGGADEVRVPDALAKLSHSVSPRLLWMQIWPDSLWCRLIMARGMPMSRRM